MGNEQSQSSGPADGNRIRGSEFDWADPLKAVLDPSNSRGSNGSSDGEGTRKQQQQQQQQQQRSRRRGSDVEIPGYIVEDSIGGSKGAGSGHFGKAQPQNRSSDSGLTSATTTLQQQPVALPTEVSKVVAGSAGGPAPAGRMSYRADHLLSSSEDGGGHGRQRYQGGDASLESGVQNKTPSKNMVDSQPPISGQGDGREVTSGEVPEIAVLAVKESHLEALDLMVENGELESVNGRNAAGDTLLCIAVKHNRFKSVLWLCNNGADIHARGRGGHLPLNIAEQLGHKGLEKFLSVWSNIALNSPLHLASLQGNMRGLRLALPTSQSMINAAEPFGHHTPLQLAVKQQHFECAELLISHKADLHLHHPLSLETPLATAVLLHNDALVMLLIQKGAKTKNHLNKSLSSWAVDRNCSKRIVDILLACERSQAGGGGGGTSGGSSRKSSDRDGLDGFRDVGYDDDEAVSLDKAASAVPIRPRSVSPSKLKAPEPSTQRLVPTDLFNSLVSPTSLRPVQQPRPVSSSPPTVIGRCKLCGTDVMSDTRRIKNQDEYFHDDCYRRLRVASPTAATGPSLRQQPRPNTLEIPAERQVQVHKSQPESEPQSVLALPPLPPAVPYHSPGRHSPGRTALSPGRTSSASRMPDMVREEDEGEPRGSFEAGQGSRDVEISRGTKLSAAEQRQEEPVDAQFRELAVGNRTATTAANEESELQRAMRLKKEEAERLKTSIEAGQMARMMDQMMDRDRMMDQMTDRDRMMDRVGVISSTAVAAASERLMADEKTEKLSREAMERTSERHKALAREAAEEREAAKKRVKAMRIQAEVEASKRIEEAARASYEKEAKVREAAQLAAAERNRELQEARARDERLKSEQTLRELTTIKARAMAEEVKRAEIARLEAINVAEKEKVRERLARQREEEARRQEEIRRVAHAAGEARREAEARERRQKEEEEEEEKQKEQNRRMVQGLANGSHNTVVGNYSVMRNSPPGYESFAANQGRILGEEDRRRIEEKRRADYMAVLQMQRANLSPVSTNKVKPSSPSAADSAAAEEISIAPPLRKLTLSNDQDHGVASDGGQLTYEEEIVEPLQNVKVNEVLIVEADYEADYVDELDLIQGQQVLVTGEANDPGWIIGLCDGRKGLVPLTHVRRSSNAANDSVVSLS